MRKPQITSDWNFGFDVFPHSFEKKSLFILQKRERRAEKLFPAWCLRTVNTSNIRCDSCSVREIRTKIGSWGDWCFDLSCINTLEEKTHISSTQTIKVVSLGSAGSYCFQQSCLINPGTRICLFKRFLMSWRRSDGAQERRGKKRTGDGSIPTTGWLNWGGSSKSTGYSGWED